MWIRTQDKLGLYKVDNIYVGSSDKAICSWFGHTALNLGEYDTESEALRVLDRLQSQHDMDVYEHGPEGMRVFQMPEKGFSEGKE